MMKISTAVLSLATLAMPAFAGDDFVMDKRAVMFVLDISGSMAGRNITQVQGTLAQVVKSMPESAAFGLVSFAGCSSADVKLEVPLAPGTGAALVSKANSLRPYGSTDIFGGLQMAESEIRRLGEGWCVKLMLLSDGDDTCRRGDVKAITKKIVGDGEGCTSISTISIGVPAWESQVLEEIAKDGKGKHTPVDPGEDIEKVIDKELEDFLKKKDTVKGPDWKGEYDKDKKPTQPGVKPGEDPDEPATNPGDLPEEDEAKLERKRKKSQ